jgi:uncharacterized protein YjiS (DUF1127 family)
MGWIIPSLPSPVLRKFSRKSQEHHRGVISIAKFANRVFAARPVPETSHALRNLPRNNTDTKKDTAMISALITAITHHRQRARAISVLKRLDDHRLRDLGIARDQIELFVAGKI